MFPNTAAWTIPYAGSMASPGPAFAAQWAVIDLLSTNVTTSKAFLITFSAL
ncbi:MAG TPA: hypothetical protein VFI25_12305 [Planctomycetota bacterium]|jgi:hypothetical protein|nr:hypothetical protein [Planctomycetota bacterium]